MKFIRNLFDGEKLQNGDKIQITWLPKNNGFRNSYIGGSGVVEDLNENGFVLRYTSGACLIVGPLYTFKKIN